MSRKSLRFGPIAALGLLFSGCYPSAPEGETVAELEQAVNVCNASVPASLVLDGIPAYDQCSDSNRSAIYSNNGVDTATSAASSEWKRTQYSGGYQCTELIHRYWLFKWGVTWFPNGDAWTFCDSTPPANSGIVKTTTPVHGDTIVFARGSCGADSTYGHVALVDTVDLAASKLSFVEQNRAGRRSCALSCATCFLHVVANDGAEPAGSGGNGGSSGSNTSAGTSLSTRTTALGGSPSTRDTQTRGGGGALGGSSASGGQGSLTKASSATGGRQTSRAATASGGMSPSSRSTAHTPTGGTSSVEDSESAFGGTDNGTRTGDPRDADAGNTDTTGASGTGNSSQSSSAVGATVPSDEATAVEAGQSAPDETAGCGCRLPRSSSRPWQVAGLGFAFALAAVRKRRRPTG